MNMDQLLMPSVTYDFEQYVMEHAIPKTLDPLPYRKTGSVFGGGPTETNQDEDDVVAIVTSAKNDPRLRTVVCRHWLRDLCMKGTACEFLHQYDLSKMPLCRRGDNCKVKDCPFRHISEANKMECNFYSQGFCIHGPFCRYKHQKRTRDDIPLVADFTLGLSQMQQQQHHDGEGAFRNHADGDRRNIRVPAHNEFYKISLCKHFLAGHCPFGDNCHFAHGVHELRKLEQPPGGDRGSQQQRQLQRRGYGNNENDANENADPAAAQHDLVPTTGQRDYYTGGQSGGGKPIPIHEPGATYYIVQAASQRDLATSQMHGEWFITKRHALHMNQAIAGYPKLPKIPVMIFFTVSESRHFQGAALVTGPATYVPEIDHEGDQDDSFTYQVPIEWYRTTEFPVIMAQKVIPDLRLPGSAGSDASAADQLSMYTILPWTTGEKLMKALWNSPLVTLYESWNETEEVDQEGNPRPRPSAEELLLQQPGDEGHSGTAPVSDDEPWPVAPGPGFIFGCSAETMDECLGRGILGLPAHMQLAAQATIVPGTTIFLFNLSDRLLFGIFEAVTPAIMNIIPTAFSKNPNAKSSPFPVQIRFRVGLECPPLEDSDPVLNDVLRSRGTSRIGPLTHAQTVAVATLLAQQCGALQYMEEYVQARDDGAPVRAPPIALPPKKIPRKDDKPANSDVKNEPTEGTSDDGVL
jgi:cleavage and polyadenylation specificity factor subunit 4